MVWQVSDDDFAFSRTYATYQVMLCAAFGSLRKQPTFCEVATWALGDLVKRRLFSHARLSWEEQTAVESKTPFNV